MRGVPEEDEVPQEVHGGEVAKGASAAPKEVPCSFKKCAVNF